MTNRRKRQRWSAEEKIRITRESFASGESVTAVAARYGIARNRLSAWRSQLRQGKLIVTFAYWAYLSIWPICSRKKSTGSPVHLAP